MSAGIKVNASRAQTSRSALGRPSRRVMRTSVNALEMAATAFAIWNAGTANPPNTRTKPSIRSKMPDWKG